MKKKTYKFECGNGVYCFVFGVRSYEDAVRIAEARIVKRRKSILDEFRKLNTEENVVIVPDGEARIIFSPIE